MLADLEQREPALLNTLQSALTNANELSITTNAASAEARPHARRAAGAAGEPRCHRRQPRSSTSPTRFDDLAKVATAAGRSPCSRASTSRRRRSTIPSINCTVSPRIPKLRPNLIDTTRYIAQTSQTIALLVGDFRNVTGNAQTQAQLRDTVANIDATTQRAQQPAGRTRWDAAACTASIPTPRPRRRRRRSCRRRGRSERPRRPARRLRRCPARASPATGTPLPAKPIDSSKLRARLQGIAANLVAIQVRVSELSVQNAGTYQFAAADPRSRPADRLQFRRAAQGPHERC